MKDEEEDIDLIEAYLRGTLDGQALAAFQKRRQDDPEFDREVIDYSQIINQIRTTHEKNFITKVKRWDSEIENRQEAKVIPLRTIFSIAASVLLVALVGVYLLRNSQPDHEQLFQEYFQPYENVISERSGKNDSQQRGMELYDLKKYDEAIIQLKRAVIEDSDNPAIKCYLGIAYLAAGHLQEAKTLFETMVHVDNQLFRQVAEWNLALTYLNLDNEALLKKTLEGIVHQNDHQYREQAADLLRQL
jgi:tetratricopeptide (TPR) repeat protein